MQLTDVLQLIQEIYGPIFVADSMGLSSFISTSQRAPETPIGLYGNVVS